MAPNIGAADFENGGTVVVILSAGAVIVSSVRMGDKNQVDMNSTMELFTLNFAEFTDTFFNKTRAYVIFPFDIDILAANQMDRYDSAERMAHRIRQEPTIHSCITTQYLWSSRDHRSFPLASPTRDAGKLLINKQGRWVTLFVEGKILAKIRTGPKIGAQQVCRSRFLSAFRAKMRVLRRAGLLVRDQYTNGNVSGTAAPGQAGQADQTGQAGQVTQYIQVAY